MRKDFGADNVKRQVDSVFGFLGTTATFKKNTHTMFNDRGEPENQVFNETNIQVIPYKTELRLFGLKELGNIDMATPTFAVPRDVEVEKGDELLFRGEDYLISRVEPLIWDEEVMYYIIQCPRKQE